MPYTSHQSDQLYTPENSPDLQSVPRHRCFTQHDMVETLRKAVPFDYIAILGLDIDRFRFGEGVSMDTDLPPAYFETYYADELHKSDPFIQASLRATDVVIESEIYAQEPPSPRLAYVTRSFGIFNRTLFPLRRNDTLYGAIFVSREQPFDKTEIAFLRMVAESLHRCFTDPLMERFGAAEMKLTDGELACLRAASSGQTSLEVAGTTGFQLETVNSYVKSAMKKLGASNRVEVIAQAIRRRLIP